MEEVWGIADVVRDVPHQLAKVDVTLIWLFLIVCLFQIAIKHQLYLRLKDLSAKNYKL